LIDEEYPLEKGWALKEKNVSGKGKGKQMKKKSKKLTRMFFSQWKYKPTR